MREHNYIAVALIIGAFIMLAAISVIAAQGTKLGLVVYAPTTLCLVWSIVQGAKGATMTSGMRFNNQAQFGLLGIIGTFSLVILSVFKI